METHSRSKAQSSSSSKQQQAYNSKGVQTVELLIPVVDDKLVEDEETLYLELGGKVLIATIEDNEENKAEIERIVVRNDNGREFSNWDYKHKGLEYLMGFYCLLH